MANTSTRDTAPWVAPSAGGYSAQSPNGKTVVRPTAPPKNGASVTPPRQ